MRKPSGKITIFSIGHSTRSMTDFINLVDFYRIEKIIDIRTIPKSRYNPQFEKKALEQSLKEKGLAYEWWQGLGGLRKPKEGSPNEGLTNEGFRGYADYMLTPEFLTNVEMLIDESGGKRSAVMCAEAVPWRCHRNLLSDFLTARGVEVVHIIDQETNRIHRLNKLATLHEDKLVYPPDQQKLF